MNKPQEIASGIIRVAAAVSALANAERADFDDIERELHFLTSNNLHTPQKYITQDPIFKRVALDLLRQLYEAYEQGASKRAKIAKAERALAEARR